MDPRQISERRRAFQRGQRLGTQHPICRVCGISDPRVRFERHHIAARFKGHHLSEETVLLCRVCHDRISDMMEDYPRLDPGLNPQLAFRINQQRGHASLLRLMADQCDRRADEYLAVHQIAAANDGEAQ